MHDQSGRGSSPACWFIRAYFVTCCLVTLGCALLGIDTYLLDGLVLGGTP